MYQHNKLIKPGGINLKKVPIDLTKNDLPTYLLATSNDHIVPWKSAYSATSLYKGPLRFTLSGSGHVAGVINHPSNNKYNHWSNNKAESSPDKWLAKATEKAGSWWPDWLTWLTKLSGSKVKALTIDKKRIIEDAPGSYVKALVTNTKSAK
jgi:polyhydroxyalkanoate synthase